MIGSNTIEMAPPQYEEEVPNITSFDQLVDSGNSYLDVIQESKNFLIMKQNESLIDALKRMDPGLVGSDSGDSGCFGATTILEGQIGCCTKYGRTFFLGPGNYLYLGLGVKLYEVRQVETTNRPGTEFSWKDITYVSLPENRVGVVQHGNRQLVVGSGRYIFRHPTRSYGSVDVQDMVSKLQVDAITEVAGEAKTGVHERDTQDYQKKIRIPAGEFQKVGAITFVRSQPGFCYVVQDPRGNLRSGIGFYVCRGGEVFKTFVDRQHYSRTTRIFFLESKDRQEVRVRVQLRWRLENAKLWLTRQGASEDIFDAIEEVAQSFLRDAVAAHSYEDCLQQASEGYDAIEKRVRIGLNKQTAELGGRLLGFEVRELRFPLLEERNKERAFKEALMKEKLLEGKRSLEIETQNRTRDEAKAVFAYSQRENQMEHSKKIALLQQKEDSRKFDVKSKLDVSKSVADFKLAVKRAEAEQNATRIQTETETLKQKAIAARSLIDKQALAAEKIQLAKADAQAILSKAEAEAQSKIRIAEADAKAADLIGSAYRANGDYVKIELAKVETEMLKYRANCLSTAMMSNKGVMMPVQLQNELSHIEKV